MMRVLYHYTNLFGYEAILRSRQFLPSLRATNPRDARYGDGQYLTDIQPHTMRPGQLSYYFLKHPFGGRRFTHFLGIDVKGLKVVTGRKHVLVVLDRYPLDLTARLTSHGENRI